MIAGDASLRVLILERADARHEYLVAEPVSVALERGEVPAGYRFLPQTLGSGAAVFERAPGDERQRDYRATNTVFTGNLQKDILQAAGDGYKVLSISGGVDGWLAMMERPAGGAARSAVPGPEAKEGDRPKKESKVELGAADYSRPFLVLATSKTGTIAKELQAAVSQGFRVVGAAGATEVMYVLEKQAPDATRPEYLLLATTKSGTLEKEMNESAARGFRLHPQGMASVEKQASIMGTVGFEIVALMEKAASPEPLQYKVVGTKRLKTLEKEIGDATANGYELARLLIGHQEQVAVMQKPQR